MKNRKNEKTAIFLNLIIQKIHLRKLMVQV